MTIAEAILLGLIQGLTEFLPVSSSGHLLLAAKLFGVELPGLTLEIALHGGTLIAVCLYFYKDILAMLRHPIRGQMRFLILATLPAVAATLLLGDYLDALFSGALLGIAFLLTTAVLWFSSTFRGEKERIGYRESAIMGVAQAIALMPGLSRSGTTISGGLIAGLNRESAARFSFLMSIPAILGAMVFQAKDLFFGEGVAIPVPSLIVGVAAAAISGLFAIEFMMRIVKKAKLKWFGVYTLLLGLFVLADQFFLHLLF